MSWKACRCGKKESSDGGGFCRNNDSRSMSIDYVGVGGISFGRKERG